MSTYAELEWHKPEKSQLFLYIEKWWREEIIESQREWEECVEVEGWYSDFIRRI
jgi:hypothetical protein